MAFSALTSAPTIIQLHVFLGIAAMIAGPFSVALRGHGAFGRWCDGAFIVAVALAALTSLFIHEVRQMGAWSWEHLLALLTLAMIGFALWRRDLGDERRYRQALSGVFAWSVLLAFGLALLPGRLLHTALLAN